jgi:hypothetical protein
MMKTSLSFLLTVLMQIFSDNVTAQYSFHREYSIPGPAPIAETADGGFIVATFKDSSQDRSLVLFRIGSKGDLKWSKRFWSDSSIKLSPFSINISNDSSYWISGEEEELSSNGWCCNGNLFCMKTDKNGNLLWSRKLGYDSLNEFAVFPSGATLTTNGNLVMTAVRNDSSGNYSYSCAFELDSAGNLDWCTNVEIDGLFLISPMETWEGDIVIQGQYFNNYDPASAIACQLSPTGNLLWCKSYTFDTSFISHSIVFSGCDYFIIGNTSSDCCPTTNPLVLKIDGNGNFLWAKEYTSNWGSGQSIDGVETCDGGAIFTTWSQQFLGNFNNAGVSKIDSSGNVQWTHQYSGDVDGDGALHRTLDNGLVVTSSRNLGGAALQIFKTNDGGQIPCNDTSVILSAYNKICVVSNLDSTSTAIPIENLYLQVSAYNLTDSLICLDSFTVASCVLARCGTTQVIPITEKSFSLSPNPASEYFAVAYQTKKELTAMIIDEFGKEVNALHSHRNFKVR